MKNIITIFKKDFFRVIKDKRLVLSVLIVPGLMIYLIYSMMGNAILNNSKEIEVYEPTVHVVNLSEKFNDIIESTEYKVNIIELTSDTEVIKNKDLLREKKIDLIIVFEEDFDQKANNEQKPSYQIYYNPTENNSYNTYLSFTNLMSLYEKDLISELRGDINLITHNEPFEIFDEIKAKGKGFAMLLPFLIITFLFAGAMAIGPESISGEKERGTIATILITPIKRTELAFGKILALSTLAIMSALSSFVGIMLSLPKLLGESNVSANIYSVIDYILILLILLSTVAVIVGLISIVSAFAKSVKEAGLYILPLYIISMLIGLASMFNDTSTTSTTLHLIPIYNSIQSLSSVFMFESSPTNIILTIGSNIIYALILSLLLARMFKSEKIMFAK